ncbi:MAG: bifunctional (p)ppGpp synthetase/guanosine-3',5'-bis(diphosphate) 3'-pyrophosphohydrolase [Ruminococcaceae bacterium]|nr:bifunctional (p)ppGpp synthetase/guanosine-3',5'-bis(diphosphate) 3'-pyrophosphohydrolase [Oscillospiraceae bacterium]
MAASTERLFSILQESGKRYDTEKIQRAFYYAEEAHRGQFRKSGEEYIYHPLSVAEICAELNLDTDAICAALLHDIVEDCPGASLEGIKTEFGGDVMVLVDGLTKLVAIPFEDKEEEHIENLRKMFLAMSRDIRVILIKLCDRLHNMRTLASHLEEKQRLIALETMHVYAPLAHRLGIQRIKQELESLALQYLDPIGYEEIRGWIDTKYGENRNFIENVKKEIGEKLSEQSMEYSIKGRVKSIYSIYRKMYRSNKSFDEIYDFYAVRIIVDSEIACYTALGLIHEMYHSMPGRFKDYISTPKPNNYRSLHTTVIGRAGVPFEVQIRTMEMHQIAEYGIAAHWKYKSGQKSGDGMNKKLEWISMLLESEQKSMDSEEYLTPLKIDIFEDEIFVFTPKGDVVTLPTGSCGIDFAYAIHSGVGNKMVGVKINGAIAPITTVLQTGQIVEVLTSSASKGPSRDWLKVVKSGEAKNKIRGWYKKEKREENIQLAKSEVDKEFEKISKGLPEEEKERIMLTISKRHGLESLDDLYNSIGYGGIALSKIHVKIRDEIERSHAAQTPVALEVTQTSQAAKKELKKSSSGVIIEGLDNCQVKFAKCCSPLPGDEIIGYITRGYGVSVHKFSCPHAKEGLASAERDRWINASWAQNAGEEKGHTTYNATLLLLVADNIGVMASISTALAEMRIPISAINTQASAAGTSLLTITIGIKGRDHLNAILERLKKNKEILQIRVGGEK